VHPPSAAATAPRPLSDADLALIETARDTLVRHYRPHWHTVAAAIRSRDGRIWTGIHLGATVGRLSVCAEAVALGRAIIEGDGTVDLAVAVRHPKPEETDRDIAVVSPCGACREMLLDFDPDADIVIGGPLSLARVSIRDLLPTPYRR
jgi:cytidine deaminase